MIIEYILRFKNILNIDFYQLIYRGFHLRILRNAILAKSFRRSHPLKYLGTRKNLNWVLFFFIRLIYKILLSTFELFVSKKLIPYLIIFLSLSKIYTYGYIVF